MGQFIRDKEWDDTQDEPCFFPVLNTGCSNRRPDILAFLPIALSTSRGSVADFCSAHGVEPSRILQATWAILLQSYTGSGRPVFAYNDFQTQSQYKKLGATCVADLAQDRHVLEFLQNKVEVVHPDAQAPQRQWFDTALEYDSNGYDEVEKHKDFSILLRCNSDSEATLHYKTATLSEEQASLIADVVVHITTELTRVSHLQSINLCSPQSFQTLSQWNSTAPEKVNRRIHDPILEHCQSQPQTLAIRAWDGDLTYGEVGKLSNAIAHQLVERGVGPDMFVGLYFEKSKWTAVALLSVLRAGGAYVFLDCSFPSGRLQEMCRQVGISHVLSVRRLFNQAAAALQQTIIAVDDNFPQPPAEISLAEPHNIAYAVFTSGSTGKPKGALVTHISYSSSQKPLAKFVGLDSHSRLFQFSSYAFDMINYELLSPLMVGACSCVPSETQRRSRIPETVREMQVNQLSLTPTVARLLNPSDFPSVETFIIIGEPPSLDVISAWAKQTRLINGYGPAECSVFTAAHHIRPGDSHPTIIGAGIGAHCWITDPSDPQRLVPVGGIGELLVEGPIVGRGYVDDPLKTEQTHIESPPWRDAFPGVPEGKMYRTGDLVQFVSGSEIRYLGRIDSQVKLRGQRLEMGEIEQNVRDVFSDDIQVIAELVTPSDNSDRAPILVAFVQDSCPEPAAQNVFAQPSAEFRQRAQDALSKLESRLPGFMIPSVMVRLSCIPTSATGKADRKRLRREASLLTRQELEAFTREAVKQKPPESQVEHALYEMVQKVLGIDDFGMNDDFFHLGGDSVLAMKLTTLAREAGFNLAAQHIFKTPVLGDLALSLEMKLPQLEHRVQPFSLLGDQVDSIRRVAQEVCGLSTPDEIEDIYPCTPLQEEMMAASLKGKGDATYVIRTVYRLPRAIDTDRLRRAWDEVILANAILRTRIIQTNLEQTLQVVVEGGLKWQRGQFLERSVALDAQQQMRLGQPLLRLTLVEHHLIFTIHHALCDGWSLSRTLSQVEAAYYGESQSSKPFNIFVDHLCKSDHSKSKEFWANQLDGFSGAHFPNRPSGDYHYQPNNIQRIDRLIHPKVTQGSGTTLGTALGLAWALVVSQYSGSDDVVFGSTVAGRSVPISGIDEILGPTFATIPLRVKIDYGMTAQEMLRRLHKQTAQSIGFENIGLRAIKSLGPEAAAACQFQSLLIIQPWDTDEPSTMFGSVVESLSAEVVDSYIITMEARLGKDGSVKVVAEYDSDAIPEQFMARIMGQFIHNLSEITSRGDSPLGHMTTASTQDLELIKMWNSAVPKAHNCCVHDVIDRHAVGHAQQQAVVAWDGSLTYAELKTYSETLAGDIQGLGIGLGEYVAIFVGKSRWTVVAMMATMKAGASFILLDPANPIHRLRQICDDTNASLVLTSTQHLSNANALELRVLKIDDTQRTPSSCHWVEADATPDNILYAVFTSGSTGRPKGVLISHSAFLTSAVINGGKQHVNSQSRVLQLASFTFDASIAEILYPLAHGGCVCIPSADQCRNNLEKAMCDYNITWATLTPSLARALTPSKLTTLKTLALGGEAMTKLDIDMWASRLQLVNGYGPAESSVDALIQPDISPQSNAGNIGRSYAGAAWIVDPNDHTLLVPVGAIGELVLEGPTLAQGYLNDPVKTSAAFVDYPPWLLELRHGKSGKLYKTGDLAMYSPKCDGSIRYVGRKDLQVKLRGQRIELGEVEHHLRECLEGAKEVIVEIGTTSDAGAEPILAAFVMFQSELSAKKQPLVSLPDAATLGLFNSAVAALETRIPSYMIPSLFLVLSRAPLSSTGKVDRRLLREELSRQSRASLSSSVKRAPRSPEEKVVQMTMSSLLKVSPCEIGFEDNFFHRGGDSLMAMRLVGRVRDDGFALTVADIFARPRLSDLALVLSKDDLGANSVEAFSLIAGNMRDIVVDTAAEQCGTDRSSVEDVYPCTPMQEALFSSSMKMTSSYVAHLVFSLDHDIDIDRLRAAWGSVYSANSILRTRFLRGPGNELLQAVLSSHIDSSPDLEPLIVDYGKPLLKMHCSDSHMHLWIHHCLYDAVTLSTVLGQLKASYRGQEIPASFYRNFIAYTAAQDMDASSEFWQEEFRNMDAAVYPPRRSERSSNLEPAMMRTLSRTFSVPAIKDSMFTLPTMLNLASALVFGHYAASEDVAYGLTLAGRNAPMKGIEQVVGPTMTTIPFRVQLLPHGSIADNLSAVQGHLLQLVPHEQMGLQNIRLLNDEAAASCDFQCHLVIQTAEDGEEDDSSVFKEVRFDEDNSNFASYPLVLVFTPSADKTTLQLNASYDTSYLDEDEIARLFSQLHHVLEQISKDQEAALARIKVASPSDLELIYKLNSAVPGSVDALVHELVFENCKLQPERPAVSSWDGCLTYGQLYDYSSRLSAHFMALGIGTQPYTVICTGKSCWTIVVILAVLHAGSACAMIDPSHPKARMQQILDQTAAKFLIVSPETQKLVLPNSSSEIHVVSEELVTSLPTQLPKHVPRQQTPSDPCIVFFTSGSTGQPKGAVLEHRSIATSLHYLQGILNVHDESRVLHFASYAFDISMWEIFIALTTGGCLCIPSETERNEVDKFIRKENVTFASLAASGARLLQHPSHVPSLEALTLGGEPLSPDDIECWAGSLRLFNMYGPAECSFMCAGGQMPAKGWIPGTIGPMLNAIGWITEPTDPSKLAAWGAVGELLVEGDIIAREYLGGPEKTAASLIHDPPWLARLGRQGRMYRTGDLVQYTRNGHLRYVGRRDRQVKLRGQRIELAEVESHLKASGPPEAVMIVEIVAQKLCAFACLSPTTQDHDYDTLFETSRGVEAFAHFCQEAKSKLASSLPRYMVPETFIQLKHVPLTASEKIDRRRLVEMATAAGLDKLSVEFQAESCPLSTEAEMAMARLWADTIGLSMDKISANDNFFHVGGDSITAMKLAAAARKRGMNLTVHSIFTNPCLSDMALLGTEERGSSTEPVSVDPFALLDQATLAERIASAADQCSIQVDQVEDMYPCSPLQEALVSQSMQRPGAYVGSFGFTLPPTVDIARFQPAWIDVAEKNPILRTTVVQVDSSLFQVVVRDKLTWTVSDSLGECASSLQEKEFQLGMPLVQLMISDKTSLPEFFFVVHHVLYDGFSLNLIFRQVSQAYDSQSLRSRPFSNFISHINQSPALSKQYWMERLDGCNGIRFPSLPSLEYSPYTDSTASATSRLKPLKGVTSATILQLAWASSVSTYTDSKDVVYGLVLSGRNADLAGIESISGPTITTVPMRISLEDKDESIKELLHKIQEETARMTPFEQFGLRNIKQLGGDSEAACNFQNLLLIQPATEIEDSTEGLWAAPIQQADRNAGRFSAYALEVTCELSRGTVKITFDFDQKVIQPIQAERMLSHFSHLVEEIQDRIEAPTSQLNMLESSPCSEIMQWNETLPEAVSRCIHDGIRETCEKTPGAAAVCAWDGEFTYGELDELSSRFAAHLQAHHGIGPEVYVPILAEKSRWVAIAIVGVIRAGGAIVLLDPLLPFERLQTICQAVDAKLIVASESCRATAQQLAPVTVDMAHTFEPSAGVVDPQVVPGNALYIIFTSGSTGKPKGIVIEHEAFYTSGFHQQKPLYIDAETRTLQFASHAFDVSVADYLWTFLAGGCVCVPSQNSLKDDHLGVFNSLRVNRADLTPSVARVLRPESIPTVKTLLLGGEPLSQADVQVWSGRVRLVNGYGPSEASVCCVLADVYPETDASNIGQAYGILPWIVDKDDHERLLPIGAIGELVLEGHSLARGYLGDSGQTSASFISSPKWLREKRPHSRLYKTGDLAQYNSNGTIRYIGRKDTQVKIRGQRVELGEIEHQLRQASPSVRDTVAELITRNNSTILAAFVLEREQDVGDDEPFHSPPSHENRRSSQCVVSKLQGRLPPYMVPSVFIPLKKLPLSPSAKVDRRRLRELASSLSKEEWEGYQTRHVTKRPPQTTPERLLQEVVSEVLRLPCDDVGMDDDFFRLGGDSIIALHFVERARASGFAFRVSTVFKTPKLADLALMRQQEDPIDARIPPQVPNTNGGDHPMMTNGHSSPPRPNDGRKKHLGTSDSIVDTLPVSQATERFLLVTPEYWILNLQGPVDRVQLQSACTRLVQRHRILQSIFVRSPQYLQLALREIDTTIESYQTASEVLDFVEQYRLSDDIAVPTLGVPITKFLFVENKEGCQALVVRLSHAQFDGYCLHTLWKDLKSLYEGEVLPEAADYSSHMELWAASKTPEAFSFWRNTLQGSEVTRITNKLVIGREPGDNETGFVTTSRRIHIGVDPREVTMATLVKTAWAMVLGQLTGHNDVVFAQAINGRGNTPPGVVGLCLNFAPVRVKLDSTQTPLRQMQLVQRQHHEILDYELLDFRDIVRQSTGWPTDTLHQSLLVHQNIDPDLPFSFGDAEAQVTCCYHWGKPPDDILVESRPLGDGDLQLTLDTTASILTQESADMVLERFCQTVVSLGEYLKSVE
ncbi:uncharacterized protein F5Z01DRAFT_697534 [Emericellopsis atlantica]|uniref:Carrier domain-containing protein n=1 Tax=Emericellopsis atlantica TaxID=2614577 RepID=A0A9P7ZR79_9HYPO|nr:uncharacterized protein F5Z01DRAFT_697534 [Emericellopsis atlantica]KAG9256735.1 hypothetical protein F5Z01DRAFT_697534 [Emericellopsis atlantica]